jgi:hypothetical protein
MAEAELQGRDKLPITAPRDGGRASLTIAIE